MLAVGHEGHFRTEASRRACYDAQDKRFAELQATSDEIKNKMKINDFLSLQTLFEKLNKQLEKTLRTSEGVQLGNEAAWHARSACSLLWCSRRMDRFPAVFSCRREDPTLLPQDARASRGLRDCGCREQGPEEEAVGHKLQGTRQGHRQSHACLRRRPLSYECVFMMA